MALRSRTTLSIVLHGDQPPTEFRIFAAGKNETTKGTFTFDDAAAKSVMAEYAAHGIDLMVDYDHASLGTERAVDPANAGKAAAWFQLAVRNGELWAVNVRWTPPAADALMKREWRFMSPAFTTDDAGRVLSLLNVAITNLPATRRLDPLMAASITALGAGGMDPKLIQQALDALIAGDDAKCSEILKGLVASAAGADPDAATEDAPPPVGDGGADEPAEMADKPPPPPAKDDKAAIAASISWIHAETGKTTLSASIDEIKVWKASHLKLEAETERLNKDRAALEASERKRLYVELVTLGGRAPSTVWADDKAKKPKPYLVAMSIADLREHVSEAKAANVGKAPPAPPAGGSPVTGAHGLSADELKFCKDANCDPAVYAQLKAQRDSVKK